jgi:uncharacterized membrane protein
VFLAGTSASWWGKEKRKKQLSQFLLKRGLWLMLLELTSNKFCMEFLILLSHSAGYRSFGCWGWGMVILSALISFAEKVILALGLFMLFTHNLLDNIHANR